MNVSSRRSDIRNVILCVLIVIAVCFATEPFVEIGVNDDWSYILSAQDLARTGRIIYNGWAAAMLGAQLYWGALFALIFGHSYTAVRLSCIPLAALSAALCYGIFRRSGIASTPALMGTLTVGTSPLFLPHAVTFMSEVPSLAMLLATVYAFSRADEKRDSLNDFRAFALWVTVGTVVGATGGTIRQINWMLALVAPALLALRVYTSRPMSGLPNKTGLRLTICAVSLFATSAVSVVASLWFAHQPFSIVENVGPAIPAFYAEVVKNWLFLGNTLCRLLWTLTFLSLPIIPIVPRLLWQTPIRKNLVPLFATMGLIVILWFNYLLPPTLRFPWLVNTVMPTGVWPGVAVYRFGPLPPYLPNDYVLPLSYTVILVATVLLSNAAYLLWHPVNRRKIPFALTLWILFSVLYILTIWVKLFLPDSSGLFDRYLFPLLPGFVLALLHFGCNNDVAIPSGKSRLATYCASATLIVIYGYYAIATTSDHFRECDAVLRITNRAERAGIDRRYINGGMAFNAQTQMSITRYYNDPRIREPKNAYHAPRPIERPQYPMMNYTPDVWGVLCVTPTPVSQLYDLNIVPEPVRSRYTNRRVFLYVQTHDRRYTGMTLEQIAASTAQAPPTEGYIPKDAVPESAKLP